MQVIVFAFTTTSYVLGPDGEQALKARLEKRSKGIPVLLPCPGAVVAFRTLGVRRIALIHPPWFADQHWELLTFRARDSMSFTQTKCVFGVCRLRSLPILLRKFTELYPGELYAFARTQVPDTAEAIFFVGNGFRAVGMIAALEEDLGRPVLTGNQVAFWYAMRQAGVRAPVNGYGRVFSILNSEGR